MNLLEHLQPLPTELLKAMARGEVDAQAVAAQLMAGRGLDRDGKWVGFERAAKEWGAE
ncbi:MULTISPECIES: hypothetical protein [unclassified Pseudomonas]|uniref:hypothetical protein n=1 Tax=unclassified Pseudomonas TaxID=196821 RepID=UPI00244C9760|nr:MULTISPECIES: hypothetical protein [unclassified Pseudomonas]MDG9925001.1 hypothetical protein [Pseudomonas sp. GD04045]MDH0036282.1 hypothetical protein [Pseudomonas sp. GD04019]